MRRAAFTVLLTAAATAYVAPPSARTSGRATARRFDTSTAPPGRRATVLHFGGPQLDFAVDEETADFVDVSAVFIDSFWADKAEKELTDSQRRELRSGQLDDFKRRYALRRNTRRQAALFVARDGAEIIGCAGVELDGAADDDTLVPVLSNVATARAGRRRGVATTLVKAAEQRAKEWGCRELDLVVEAANRPARSLYSKLGYKVVGTDAEAETLVPTADGRVTKQKTKQLTMRRDLGAGAAGGLLAPVGLVVALAAANAATGGAVGDAVAGLFN